MDTPASVLLLVLALVAYSNYSKGTLGKWFKAKFFNSADAVPTAGTRGGFSGGGGSGSGSGGAGGWLSGTKATGSLVRPVPGPITSPFGAPRAGHTHAGVDLAAAEGVPISAATSGTVSARTTTGDCGNRIDLRADDGMVTRYCHLSSFAVSLGDTVRAGQTIGNVGHTGDATGPHLHFEVHPGGGAAVDPAPYLGGS